VRSVFATRYYRSASHRARNRKFAVIDFRIYYCGYAGDDSDSGGVGFGDISSIVVSFGVIGFGDIRFVGVGFGDMISGFGDMGFIGMSFGEIGFGVAMSIGVSLVGVIGLGEIGSGDMRLIGGGFRDNSSGLGDMGSMGVSESGFGDIGLGDMISIGGGFGDISSSCGDICPIENDSIGIYFDVVQFRAQVFGETGSTPC
jgi:hypothetical protein